MSTSPLILGSLAPFSWVLTNPSATLPVYVSQQTEKKRDSFVSVSSRLTLPGVGGALTDVKGLHSPTRRRLVHVERIAIAVTRRPREHAVADAP